VSGTKTGGRAAAVTNKAKYGSGFYREIGAIGGSRSTRGGYWYKKYVLGDVESIRHAGTLGGRMSRRGAHKTTEKERREIRKAYEELLGVHLKAKRERADQGAITVFDRKRGLVLSEVA
jgi:general stress protein YciG